MEIPGQIRELSDCREHELDLVALGGRQRRGRLGTTAGRRSPSHRRGVAFGGRAGDEEPGVEADQQFARRDPASERDQLGVAIEGDTGLLVQLASRRCPHRRLAVAFTGLGRAPREDPHAAHEPGRGTAPYEHHLDTVAPPHEDHRRRRAGDGRLAAVQRPAGLGSANVHMPTLPACDAAERHGSGAARPGRTEPAEPLLLPRVKYICESCGFIYDPAEGDPDGGIPPGTAFEDIPETWFCPVCGARKRDFSPYED